MSISPTHVTHKKMSQDKAHKLKSISVNHRQWCLKQDLDIQPQRPVLYIPEIMLDSERHFFLGVGDASETIYLCPTGDTGFDLVAEHVFGDTGFELFVEFNRMWPWSNQ